MKKRGYAGTIEDVERLRNNNTDWMQILAEESADWVRRVVNVNQLFPQAAVPDVRVSWLTAVSVGYSALGHVRSSTLMFTLGLFGCLVG